MNVRFNKAEIALSLMISMIAMSIAPLLMGILSREIYGFVMFLLGGISAGIFVANFEIEIGEEAGRE